MVLCSGTHGTEALVGAGLQLGLLQDPDGFLAGAPDLRVVMIHIINPYGAAWGRYVNEDNVDLMKNLTYGDRVSPTAPAFLDLDAAMDIASLGRPGAYEASLERRREVVRHWGMEGLNDALKRGQSARPEGICFNGVAASWSKRTLDAILTARLAGARRVLFVDLHSGMGEFGEAYVVTSGDADSVDLVRGWLGEAAHASDLPMDPPTHSTLAACAPGAAFAAVTLEAGTETWDDEVREAMLFEMYYHLHGDRDCDHARRVKERFKRFYYPPSDDWRRRFWSNARPVLDTFKAGLAAWTDEGAGS
jgi:hypothetical protein